VSLVYDRSGNSRQHGDGKLQLSDYFHAQARSKIDKFRHDYAAKKIAFAPAILSVAGKIHQEFLRLPWVMADESSECPRPEVRGCRVVTDLIACR